MVRNGYQVKTKTQEMISLEARQCKGLFSDMETLTGRQVVEIFQNVAEMNTFTHLFSQFSKLSGEFEFSYD